MSTSVYDTVAKIKHVRGIRPPPRADTLLGDPSILRGHDVPANYVQRSKQAKIVPGFVGGALGFQDNIPVPKPTEEELPKHPYLDIRPSKGGRLSEERKRIRDSHWGGPLPMVLPQGSQQKMELSAPATAPPLNGVITYNFLNNAEPIGPGTGSGGSMRKKRRAG
jgi:hypothetical protein